MNSIKTSCIYTIILILLVGCKRKCDCYAKPHQEETFEKNKTKINVKKVIAVDTMAAFIRQEGLDEVFGWHFEINEKEAPILTFKTKKGKK